MSQKLRTLKDIELFCGLNPEADKLNRESLREEAIKWYHRSDGDKHKFIKEFFNLTDEEIKGW